MRRESSIPVLVIDDDPAQLRQVRLGLTRAGFQVSTAQDGQEAFQRIREGTPRVILLDLEMPVMDGRRFLDILRSHAAVKTVPVIILSGLPPEDPRRQAAAQEADRVLTKPVEAAELVRVIRQVM